MKKNFLGRAEKFAYFAGKPILYIYNPFNEHNDHTDYWFVVNDWRPANPSSHIHYNEIKGYCINDIMNHTDEYDQVIFNTKLNDIDISSMKFDIKKSWVIIDPVRMRY